MCFVIAEFEIHFVVHIYFNNMHLSLHVQYIALMGSYNLRIRTFDVYRRYVTKYFVSNKEISIETLNCNVNPRMKILSRKHWCCSLLSLFHKTYLTSAKAAPSRKIVRKYSYIGLS
jgi:hypothetical protein